MKGIKRVPECGHSEAAHYALGFCQSCYYKQGYDPEKAAEKARRYRETEAYLSRKDAILEAARIRAMERYETPEGKERQRAGELKKKYGIDTVEYQRLLELQGGLCAICNKPETHTRKGKVTMLCVDHCHATGMVRGLLCKRCNVMLGQAKDNADALKSAAAYLENFLWGLCPVDSYYI